MSWSRRTLITLAFVVALLLVPVVGLVFYDFYERAQNERFYDTHPMLRSIRNIPSSLPLFEIERRSRTILLERVPLASTRLEATEILSSEGFKCEHPIALNDQNKLVCVVRSPRVRWHVEVDFDGSDKVSSGRILMLKA